jgi:hypothetical protein
MIRLLSGDEFGIIWKETVTTEFKVDTKTLEEFRKIAKNFDIF